MNFCQNCNAAFRNDGLVGHPGTSVRETGPVLVKGLAFNRLDPKKFSMLRFENIPDAEQNLWVCANRADVRPAC